MKLNLLNGLFFSRHELDLDHDSIYQEVLDSRYKPKDSTHNSRPHFKDVFPGHTFYEDTNLYDETYLTMKGAVVSLINGIFGEGMLHQSEIWGHIIPHKDQTVVHAHRDVFNDAPGLSWAYYPHRPENSGNITFITNVNGFDHKVPVYPKKGELLLFSNTLLHFTPRNDSGEDRVSVSGNLSITDKLKDILYEDMDYKNPYWYYNGRC
tara:strand:- start:2610 stop:3233 length:624 start_codon:yes stop_codon:yes gene_type:complete